MSEGNLDLNALREKIQTNTSEKAAKPLEGALAEEAKQWASSLSDDELNTVYRELESQFRDNPMEGDWTPERAKYAAAHWERQKRNPVSGDHPDLAELRKQIREM